MITNLHLEFMNLIVGVVIGFILGITFKKYFLGESTNKTEFSKKEKKHGKR